MTETGCFELDCIECKSPITFSILDLDAPTNIVTCSNCQKKYALGEETLKRQLKKFAALCRQIQDSQEILGDANVAVDIAGKSVQVPFKLLLTRLKSQLNLQIGKARLCVTFRVEPNSLPKEKI
ncbi:MAG: hypothetical protein JSR37_08945 [Verrucomicrobia bacterium]|nr:hypothetical protein [Verrucomicrobiota bacterium]MBS0637796.1 hypothetical protein [Verrucomicrobiota bacterium]